MVRMALAVAFSYLAVAAVFWLLRAQDHRRDRIFGGHEKIATASAELLAGLVAVLFGGACGRGDVRRS